jgi:hypothetical protein
MQHIDALRLLPMVMTDYRSIDAFLLHWGIGKPSAEKCDQSAKLLMFFPVGYMFVVFTFSSDSTVNT